MNISASDDQGGGGGQGEDLYDEFGNYIGPDIDSSSSDENDDGDEMNSQSSSSSSSSNNDHDDDDDDASELSNPEGDNNGMITPYEGGESPNPHQQLSTSSNHNAIVLHEDKVHYPSASTVYGSEVTTAVLDEDAMDIEEPILAPKVDQKHHLADIHHEDYTAGNDAIPTNFSTTFPMSSSSPSQYDPIVEETYLLSLLDNPLSNNRRGIAMVGNLHCGKTTQIDLFYETTLQRIDGLGPRASHEVHSAFHSSVPSGKGGKGDNPSHLSGYSSSQTNGGIRMTDTLRSEMDRQMSLQSQPITLPLMDTRGKTRILTMVDCPGHVQFHDESVAALRVVDGAVLCVDCVEGVTMHTEMLVRQILDEGLNFCLVVTRMDRLILELKLPPEDAYCKIRHLIDSVNVLVRKWGGVVGRKKYPLLDPSCNNVAFGSGLHGWCFTLSSFAQLCLDHVTDDEDEDDEDEYDEMDNDNPNSNNKHHHPLNFHGSLGKNLPLEEFSKRLWGNTYLDPTTRTFKTKRTHCKPTPHSPTSSIQRTFVQYVLEPIYKLYSTCLGNENESSTNRILRSLGIYLSRDQLRSSARPLLRYTFRRLFGGGTATGGGGGSAGASGFVDMVFQHLPSPHAASHGKVARCYTGDLTSPLALHMISCSPQQSLSSSSSSSSMVTKSGNVHVPRSGTEMPWMMHVTKLYPNLSSGKSGGELSFDVFGRIYCGTVRSGDTVRILGEAYAPPLEEEDTSTAIVTNIKIPRGKNRWTSVPRARAGNWVLLEGVDKNIAKTATLVGMVSNKHKHKHDGSNNYGMNSGHGAAVGNHNDNQYWNDPQQEPFHGARIFAPLQFPHAGGEAVMKLAIEPLNPSDLPKMVEGLRRVSKSYPMVRTRVEESGEHVLFGTGELYLDCVMHDLRHVFSDIEVKVADPVVGFRETVVETSSITCFASTGNKRNRLTMFAEPLDDGLADTLERGKINPQWDTKKTSRFFQSKYDWDLLSARSVWAFGDSPTHGPNILLDDTLPSDDNNPSSSLLSTCKNSIVQGFRWAMREGPLCEEPVRSTKIKLMNVTLAEKMVHRGGGQIIPTSRRVVHSSLLTATPRLMEPVYKLEIQCPGEIVDALSPVLNKRRGHVVQDGPIPGTPLCKVKAFLPVMDSFGFETDLRTYTQGKAMVHAVFDHWSIVPGDPLDRGIILHPLEPSPLQHLAREFLVKTRRRKGLSEDVSVVKFFDEEMRAQLDEE